MTRKKRRTKASNRPRRRPAIKAPRACGECDECCTVMEVDGLKPANERCEHACGSGCGIYEERPAPCRTFQCLWLSQPAIHDDMRPDRVGLVMYPGETVFGMTVHAAESRPGAGDPGTPGREILERIRRHLPVIILRADGRRSILPSTPEQADQAMGLVGGLS